MFELLLPKQLIFKSQHDHTLVGNINLTNNTKHCYIPYKIKCTNPNLFKVYPFHGILSPESTITIEVNTVNPFSHQMSKNLSRQHKFSVQYVLVETQPRSLDEGLAKISQSPMQSDKIYINTDNVRNSFQRTTPRQSSSRKSTHSENYTFHSAINSPRKTNLKPRDFASQQSPSQNKIDQLKKQIEFLEQQRINLRLNKQKITNAEQSGWPKKLIIFILGMIIGNMSFKAIGLTQAIQGQEQPQKSFFDFKNQVEEEEQQQGWF